MDIDIADYLEMCRIIELKIKVNFVSEDNQKKKQQIYDMPFNNKVLRVVWST